MHWLFRAEEARTVADHMTHEEARTITRRIANDYDRLAKVAEEQLAAQEKERPAIDASPGCCPDIARTVSRAWPTSQKETATGGSRRGFPRPPPLFQSP